MINRYQGNSGRMTRYEENSEAQSSIQPQQIQPLPANPVPPKMPQRAQSPFAQLEGLSRMLPEKIGELESEDIILILILYLMYRESGDSDLLIIMGAMFLL